MSFGIWGEWYLRFDGIFFMLASITTYLHFVFPALLQHTGNWYRIYDIVFGDIKGEIKNVPCQVLSLVEPRWQCLINWQNRQFRLEQMPKFTSLSITTLYNSFNEEFVMFRCGYAEIVISFYCLYVILLFPDFIVCFALMRFSCT